MPLTHKPAARDTAPVDLPEKPPKLPDDAKARFPSLVAWEEQWLSVWDTMRANIRSRDAEIERRLTKLENP